jgi:hypothetical protein
VTKERNNRKENYINEPERAKSDGNQGKVPYYQDEGQEDSRRNRDY